MDLANGRDLLLALGFELHEALADTRKHRTIGDRRWSRASILAQPDVGG
jgi:hypothetical protein